MKNSNGTHYPPKAQGSVQAASQIEVSDIADIVQNQSAPRSMTPLWELRAYLFRYKAKLFLGLIGLVAAAGAMLALPLAVRRVIDHGFSTESSHVINSYFTMLLLVAAVLAAASALRAYCVSWLGERVISDIRADVFAHLTSLSASFFEKNHSAELMSRLTADTTQIKAAIATAFSQALRNGVMLIGAIFMMLATSLKLSVMVLMAIPIIVLPLVFYGRAVRRLSRHAQDELAQASAYAAENLAAPRTMQAFTYEPVVINRYRQANEITFLAALGRIVARTGLTAVAIFLVFASIVGILWLGAHDVLAGTMSGGDMAQFVLFAAFAAGAVAELSEVWGEIQQAAGAASRLIELMDVQPDIVSLATPTALPEPPRGEIRFKNVTFAYNGGAGVPVFNGLSFAVCAGERIAIVGPSGVGKSTIFNLILRFYDPQEGVISIDGVPIDAADLTAVRQRVAYVPQDPAVFAGSIAENIRYGSLEASDEDVRRVAKAAFAADFIEALPERYDTPLGERGVTLSGGQRQRLAIARALLRDAPILLLDEATSALDAESENLVQTALNRLMQGRTTLVIAHRLSTVLDADRILVIDNGGIVEEGTHADLMGAKGVYSRLADLQFSNNIGTA